MKTLTRILSSFSLLFVLVYSVHSQNIINSAPIGIGMLVPTQKLDVGGNVQFSGAIMPAGNAGLTGNMLLSGGASPASPTWFSNGISGQTLTSSGSGLLWVAVGYWNLTGNAGTNPAVDFIGTTNDEPLIFTAGGTGTPAYAGQIDPQFEGANLKGNTYFGEGSSSNTDVGAGNSDAGTYNVGVGVAALGLNTTGSYNVALTPFLASGANTTGSYNVAIGRNLRYNLNGNGNIALGINALYGQSGTASYNTGIGYYAGYGYAGPGNNTGTATNGIGNFNTALGYEALYINAISNASSNTALGNYAADATTGKQNTAIGDSALVTNTSGNFNTALGYGANVATAALTNATAVGYNASAPASNSITLGSTAVAGGATSATTTGLYLPGYNAVGSFFYTSAASGLVLPLTPGTSGYFLQSNGAGFAPTWNNTAPAPGSVTNVIDIAPIMVNGAWTVGIQGSSSGTDIGGVLYSTGASDAAFTPTGIAGQVLTSNGTGAPTWANPANALWSITGNSNTVPGTNWIGTNDDEPLRFYTGTGSFGGAGPSGSIDPQFVGGNPKGNTYLGDPNGNNGNTTGAGNNDAGSYNVGIGLGSMGFASATATYNTAMGTHALEPINAESLTGSYNVSMGAGSNTYNGGANFETAVGWSAMGGGIATATTSSYNTAAGAQALSAGNENGSTYYHSYNTALGYQALETPSAGAGNSITAAGTNAAYHSTGNRNTAIGDSSLYTNTTGANNTAIGYFANSVTLTNAIVIGSNASAVTNNSITLGSTAVAGGTSSATTTGLYLPGYNIPYSLFYTSASSGLVASTGAGTSGYLLQSNGPGVTPAWANVAIGGSGAVTNVTGSAPIYVNGTWNVGIQGNSPNTDKGGVLYSAGAGNPAVFTATPASAGLILTSSAAGAAPTWAALPSTVWSLTGNAGTTPGTNFIGTTDATRLDFKVDQPTAAGNCGSIDPPQSVGGNGNAYYGFGASYENNGVATTGTTIGDVGTFNTTQGYGAFAYPSNSGGGANYNIAFGFQSIHQVGGAGSTGSYNIGVGYDDLFEVTTGSGNTIDANKGGYDIYTGNYNTGFGFEDFGIATASNDVASFNTAAGYESLLMSSNLNSPVLYSNTAVGYLTLQKTEYSRNTALGSYALNSNITGEYNTAVGDSAISITNTTGTYVTALGAQSEVGANGLTNATAVGAQADDSISNTLILGSVKNHNHATANSNVGIGTNAPATDASLAVATGHLETQGQLSVGNVFADAGAGSGAGVSVSSATDVGGSISFITGSSGLAAGAQLTVFFAMPYTYAPIVSITPANSGAATAMTSNGEYLTIGTGSFTINFTTAPLANTTYSFNYFAVEAQGTATAQGGTSCYVPITLTNSTATAVAAGTSASNGFQQMITVNSSTYYESESPGLQNVEFSSGNPISSGGTPSNAWLESGNSNSSGNTVWWFNLGTNGIAASGGTLTIYMNFMSSNIMSASGPTGEAPQLSGTYAQYDDGSSVFNNYWNFAGTSIPSGLADVVGASASITFNNGVTITNAGTPSGTYLYNTSTIAEGNAAESYFIQKTYPTEGATYAQALLASMVVNTSTSLASSTTSYAGSIDLQTSQNGITVPLDAWNFEIQDAFEIATVFPPPALAYESANFGENIWSLGIATTGTLGFADVNYTNLIPAGSSVKNLSAGFHIGLTLTQGTALYQWLRTRTYPPVGTMPTVALGSQTCASTPQPTETNVCYVPITLTNNQSSAVTAGSTASNGYQQMVTVNSSNYTSYESAGLQNVEFTVGAPSGLAGSTQLNSWLESGNTNSSSSTIYWLNLGTNGIAANGGTLTVYMNFMPSSNIFSPGPSPCAGEAPQLTSTYAQYDNGSLVFNNYWNFAGATIPSGLTSANATGGQITFNNGLTINPLPSVAWGTYVATSSKINAGNVAESYFEQETFPESTTAQALCAGLIVGANQTLTGTSASYAGSVDLQTGQDGVTVPLDAWNFEIQDAYNQHSFPYPVLGYETYNTNLNVWSLGINATGNLGFGDVNYINLVPGGSGAQSLSAGFYIGLSLTQETAYYQWLRTRTYPPNGVMPPITLGSIICE